MIGEIIEHGIKFILDQKYCGIMTIFINKEIVMKYSNL